MNPHNPTMTELHRVERLFLSQMQARTLGRPSLLSSFDYQCSDRWV